MHQRVLAAMVPAYDGITEVWWSSIEDVKAAMASPLGAEAMAMLLKDESQFIDFSQSCS